MASPNIGTYSISNIKDELTGVLHGTSLNQIFNLYGVFNRVARRVLGDVDPQETKVVAQFGQIWDDVFDYTLPTDLKGNKIIDLYPQANRQLNDRFAQSYNETFDIWKQFTMVPDFTPRYSNGVRTIRINAKRLQTGIQITSADGITDNGTWVGSGNASNLQNDNQYFTDGAAGSVSFQLNQTGMAGSTGALTNSTLNAVDISSHYNNGYEFFWVYLPNAAGITSIEYRLGSDANNYYDFTGITTDYMGNAWVNGWNLLGNAWSSATIVGSPVNTKINYIQVIITYNGTLQTQVRINQFYSRLGVIFNINYYSKYLFRDGTTNVFKEKVTDDSDVLNLDTDGVNLFLYATALEAVQQQQGLSGMFFDDPNLEAKYNEALAEYQSKYKSELIKPHEYYYRQPSQGYRRFLGRGAYRLP